ncbi:MAG: hypothetical protein IR527_01060 [Bacteroides sp.]|nr:MAG: hypothetical protein IR527_01060 [Bacteroides sp.]
MNKNINDILYQYYSYYRVNIFQKKVINSIILEKKDTISVSSNDCNNKYIYYKIFNIFEDGICIIITCLDLYIQSRFNKLNNENYIYLYKENNNDFIRNNILNGKNKIIYISPYILYDENTIQFIKKIRSNLIIIDEAHYIIEWSNIYKPIYKNLYILKSILPKIPILALSSNVNLDIAKEIGHNINLNNPYIFIEDKVKNNTYIKVIQTNKKLDIILKLCNRLNGSGIIYTDTKTKSKIISEFLTNNNINNLYYDFEYDIKKKFSIYRKWYYDYVKIIISNNPFSINIDKKNIQFLIYYDFPYTMLYYVYTIDILRNNSKKSFAILLYENIDFLERKNNINNTFFIDNKYSHIKIYNYLNYYLNNNIYLNNNSAYNFVLKDFAMKYSLNEYKVLNTINILIREGLISYKIIDYSFFKIKIVVNYNYLLNILLKKHKHRKIIDYIVRYYGGKIFYEYVFFDEKKISKYFSIQKDFLLQSLKSLKDQNIIKYINFNKIGNIEIIYKILKYKLYISHIDDIYNKLKIKSINELKNINKYITSNICRRHHINLYLYNQNFFKCNNCDICHKI